MTQLVRYEQARHALQVAVTVDEAKDIRDKAAALAAYARQKNDVEMERWVAEIKLRAITRIGEISRELEEAPGLRTDKPLASNGKRSKAETLKAAGISTSAAHRAEKLAEHKEQVEAYIAKKAGQRQPVKYTEALAAVEHNAREQKAAEILKAPAPVYADGLHVGDFRFLAEQIADESVELVFTDPPYDSDSTPLFADAARVAARILRPGGSLLTYCGQTQLPRALELCGQHLRYWWICAALDPGSQQRMNRYGVICQWKPLLWFVKGTRGDVQTLTLDVVAGPREKAAHPWQQAEDEAAYYIEKLTGPRGLVVDFFAGGGTTLAAARRLGRPSIGFEIDPHHAASATRRLGAAA